MCYQFMRLNNKVIKIKTRNVGKYILPNQVGIFNTSLIIFGFSNHFILKGSWLKINLYLMKLAL